MASLVVVALVACAWRWLSPSGRKLCCSSSYRTFASPDRRFQMEVFRTSVPLPNGSRLQAPRGTHRVSYGFKRGMARCCKSRISKPCTWSTGSAGRPRAWTSRWSPNGLCPAMGLRRRDLPET